jgi:peptidyl-prolyl cis-trans isomerase SurA
MAYRYIFFILLAVSINGFGQDKKQSILQIGNHFFSREEFENTYKKNNTGLPEDADMKTPSEYMELFVNFKLKVLEAKAQGLDTVPSFLKELKGYRDELAQPYLTNVRYDEEMLQTAYYRTKYERKASHILINIVPGTDTLQAWQRIMDIREKIEAGADFGEMAFLHSEDPSARQNRGDLGYFSAFMMVFPFEDVAYKTQVGEVSMPVRTRFGYHLVKVGDERESKGQISVAHIMKRFPQPEIPDDGHGHAPFSRSRESIRAEIDSLYHLLQNGTDFEELARKHSDDQYSARAGGKLPPFSEGRMIPSFAAAAFALEKDGDISPVTETMYGWHIIKRLKHIPVPGFAEIRQQLEENIRKNPQISKHSRDLFIAGLKKEYHFSMDETSRKYLIENVVSGPDGLTLNDSINTMLTLFRFSTKTYTIGDFFSFQEKKGSVANNDIAGEIDTFAAEMLIELENNLLEEKYPEFRLLMQEYHDGILLFAVSEKMVWNKASEDTLGLKKYYEANKMKYLDDGQFKGWVISCADRETRSLADEILTRENMGKEGLQQIINAHKPGAISVEEGTFKKGSHPVVDFYVWDQPKPEGMDELLVYVRGDKLPPQPKLLEESRGFYVAGYQEYLEKKWLEELHKKYKIKINKKLLGNITSLK